MLPTGTYFLFDTANLLTDRLVGYKHAARILEAISRDLDSQGYRAVFFMEYRSFVHVCAKQDSAQDVDMFKVFAKRKNFVLLYEESGEERVEADEAILQIAEVRPDTVCISNDRFKDYAAIHPDIVMSGRVRMVNVVDNFAGTKYILIRGLKKPIEINVEGNVAASVVAWPVVPEVKASPISVKGNVAASVVAWPVVPEVKAPPISVEGNVDDSGRCAKVDGVRRARHPKAKSSRSALAKIQALSSCSRADDWDNRSLLEAKRKERRIQSARRNERLRARSIREGSWRFAHFSHKRYEAAVVTALGAQLGYGRVA